ncbi:MAG: fructose-1,6-bisphosphatase I [Candidatus Peregrinibacteria bacterium Greene1014_49]|nr:MAG: fructose-1,6-bisphosphatase I [Candidatus Peregrinibacteria bacterium Greene1014_49]
MVSATPRPPTRSTLNWHLRTRAKAPDALRHLLVDISRAGRDIRYAIQTSEGGLSGGSNQFGEKQLKLDVLADQLMEHYLRESGSVACFCSEEHDDIVEIDPKAPYSVVFDPLDGSSLVDVNFAIGSIFGIYKGSEIIGRTPREQVAAGYILYGPRTIFVYSTGDGVHAFLLSDIGEFILLQEHLGIGDTAKNFSPGNLSAIHDNPGYKRALDHWLEAMTLRYSGCMVADIHHILSKGQGIFSNVGGAKYPQGKLRLIFECGPFAYLIEQAGGASSDGKVSLLDTTITACGQRTPIVVGSKKEVETVVKLLGK